MSIVECYHVPVRRAVNIFQEECPDSSDEPALQMAVKTINDSVSPDGISPTIVVYSDIPRLGILRDRPFFSIDKKALAMKKATQSLTKRYASSKVRDDFCARNGPNVANVFLLLLDSKRLFTASSEIAGKGHTRSWTSTKTNSIRCSPTGF